MPVDPYVLHHVESLGIGIPTKRKNQPRVGKRQNGRSSHRNTTNFKKFSIRTRHASSAPPPPPFSTNQKRVKILGSAASVKDPFPRETKGLSEVALAGRSNVGKSTLLNALLYSDRHGKQQQQNTNDNQSPIKRRQGLPRGVKAVTSDRPGETKALTWYQLSSSSSNARDKKSQDDKSLKPKQKASLILVDLPGYGFAYTSQPAEWQDLMEQYLLERIGSQTCLKRILLLVDARHGFKKADVDFLVHLEMAFNKQHNQKKSMVPIQIVLTKCDLVSQENLAKRIVLVQEQLSDCLQRQPKKGNMLPVMLTSGKDAGFSIGSCSSRRGNTQSAGGILELQRQLASLCPL